MQLMDWFDFVMHGIPWVLLIRVLVVKAIEYFKSNNQV